MRVFSATAGWLRIALPVIIRDLTGIAGLAAIVYGVWKLNEPAAWIIGGGFAAIISFRLSMTRSAG